MLPACITSRTTAASTENQDLVTKLSNSRRVVALITSRIFIEKFSELKETKKQTGLKIMSS